MFAQASPELTGRNYIRVFAPFLVHAAMKKFVLRLAAISVRDYDVLLAPFWPLFGGFNASDGGRPVICDRRGREAETPSPVRVRGRSILRIKTLQSQNIL